MGNEYIDFENTKNIRIWDELTLEEKVDYIYKTLKAQKRNSRIKFVLKLIVFFGLIYFIFFYIPSLPEEKVDKIKNQIQTFVSEKISTIIMPIVKDLTKNMLKDMNIPNLNWSWGLNWINLNWLDLNKISQDILKSNWTIQSDKVKDFLQKHPELTK